VATKNFHIFGDNIYTKYKKNPGKFTPQIIVFARRRK